MSLVHLGNKSDLQAELNLEGRCRFTFCGGSTLKTELQHYDMLSFKLFSEQKTKFSFWRKSEVSHSTASKAIMKNQMGLVGIEVEIQPARRGKLKKFDGFPKHIKTSFSWDISHQTVGEPIHGYFSGISP